MSGTLKTISFLNRNKKDITCETVIELDKILLASSADDMKPNTCTLLIQDGIALHVDIPIDQMRKIIKEHRKNPDKDFDTHASADEILEDILQRSRKNRQ